MIASIWIFLLAVGTAPGDIYRCVGADGKAKFQDKPCAGQPATATKAPGKGRASEQRELRQWLRQLRGETSHTASTPAPARSGRAATPADAKPWIAPQGPVDEALLSSCSERFLSCADGNEASMDRCVNTIAECSGQRRSGCCPAACTARYAELRRGGASMASAVRDALLDGSRPSCAAVAH